MSQPKFDKVPVPTPPKAHTAKRTELPPLVVENYVSKPRPVEAVQVTLENMVAVAVWCGGVITFPEVDGKSESPIFAAQLKHLDMVPEPESLKRAHILVDAFRPQGKRQTQAFPGDWVCKQVGNKFKVFIKDSFLHGHQLKSKADKTFVGGQLQSGIREGLPYVETPATVPTPIYDMVLKEMMDGAVTQTPAGVVAQRITDKVTQTIDHVTSTVVAGRLQPIHPIQSTSDRRELREGTLRDAGIPTGNAHPLA